MLWSEGQIVTSEQGREKGKHYIIIKTEDKCCYVADGRKAKATKPKKKNYKHLQGTLCQIAEISEITAQGDLPSDEKLRDFLNKYWPENGVKEE